MDTSLSIRLKASIGNNSAGVGEGPSPSVVSVVGLGVGSSVGVASGEFVGSAVGVAVGSSVGAGLDESVGSVVGSSVGVGLGESVGSAVGSSVGAGVGVSVGLTVGFSVGSLDGSEAAGGSVVSDNSFALISGSATASAKTDIGKFPACSMKTSTIASALFANLLIFATSHLFANWHAAGP